MWHVLQNQFWLVKKSAPTLNPAKTIPPIVRYRQKRLAQKRRNILRKLILQPSVKGLMHSAYHCRSSQ